MGTNVPSRFRSPGISISWNKSFPHSTRTRRLSRELVLQLFLLLSFLLFDVANDFLGSLGILYHSRESPFEIFAADGDYKDRHESDISNEHEDCKHCLLKGSQRSKIDIAQSYLRSESQRFPQIECIPVVVMALAQMNKASTYLSFEPLI